MASSMGQRSESMSPANYSMEAPPRLAFRWQERAPSRGGQYTEGPGPQRNQRLKLPGAACVRYYRDVLRWSSWLTTSLGRGVKNRLDGHKFAKLPHKTTVFVRTACRSSPHCFSCLRALPICWPRSL